MTCGYRKYILRNVQDLHHAWGEAVRDALGDRTLAWLAKTVDVHPATITRIVKGELVPNDELKWKIAGALGVRMDRLWAWPTVIPPAPTVAA